MCMLALTHARTPLWPRVCGHHPWRGQRLGPVLHRRACQASLQRLGNSAAFCHMCLHCTNTVLFRHRSTTLPTASTSTLAWCTKTTLVRIGARSPSTSNQQRPTSAIFGWNLINEPSVARDFDERMGVPPGTSLAIWVAEMAAFMKEPAQDPNHLLSVGDVRVVGSWGCSAVVSCVQWCWHAGVACIRCCGAVLAAVRNLLQGGSPSPLV